MTPSLLQSILAVLDQPATTVDARFDPPAPEEYDEYYGRYIQRVDPGDFLAGLRRQVGQVVELFGGLTPAQAEFAYAPGKWTLKEVLGHLIDTERVFVNRALWFGRQAPTPLPGFDQDAWMPPAQYGRRPLPALIKEWIVVRAATIVLAEGFPAEAPLRRGIASEKEISVRALLYVPPGHVNYHLELVRERYMGAAGWPR